MRSAETPATPAGSATWDRIRAALDPLFIAAAWLYARPRVVLAGLVATQWVAILAFALTVRHNGWVYYQGGDQIWYTTSAWLIGDGVLPPTYVGFGWVAPARTAQLARRPGLCRLPAGGHRPERARARADRARVRRTRSPLRIGGRLLGLYAAVLWVAAPYLSILYFRDDYHDRYVEQFLPQALGLTAARRLSVDGLRARRSLAAGAGTRDSGLDLGCHGGRGCRRRRDDQAVESPLPGRPRRPAPPRSPLAHGALVRRGHRPVAPAPRALEAAWARDRAGVRPRGGTGCGRGARLDQRARPVRLSRLGHVPPQHGEPARVRLQRPRAPVDSVRGRIRRGPAVAAARRPARRLVRRLPARSRERRRWRRSTAAASSGT